MGTGGVVPLKLVVDPGRGIQGLLQLVSPNQRGRAVHLIDVLNGFRNIHIGGGAIQLLAGKLLAEDGGEVVHTQGPEGTGVEQRIGLLGHGGAQVEPLLGHLVLGQIQAVGDLAHVDTLLFCVAGEKGTKKPFVPKIVSLGQRTVASASAVPPGLTYTSAYAHSLSRADQPMLPG